MKPLSRNQMITLENILSKLVTNLDCVEFQKNFTVPEIIEIKQIYRAVVSDNQVPTGAERKREEFYRG